MRFAMVDSSGDGRITFPEFTNFFKEAPCVDVEKEWAMINVKPMDDYLTLSEIDDIDPVAVAVIKLLTSSDLDLKYLKAALSPIEKTKEFKKPVEKKPVEKKADKKSKKKKK